MEDYAAKFRTDIPRRFAPVYSSVIINRCRPYLAGDVCFSGFLFDPNRAYLFQWL